MSRKSQRHAYHSQYGGVRLARYLAVAVIPLVGSSCKCCQRRNRRYWISLFEFFLMAAVVNAYRIYNIHFCNEKFRQMSHLDFQRSIAKPLLQQCHSHRHKGPYSQLVDQELPETKHHWQKLENSSYCRPCLDRQTNKQTKRKVLGEVSGNVTKKQRTRVPQPIWAWSACKVPCCRRNPTCWKQLQMLPKDE